MKNFIKSIILCFVILNIFVFSLITFNYFKYLNDVDEVSNLKESDTSSNNDSSFAYYGTYGSLIIPSANISVGLEYVSESASNKTAQSCVDEENMAGWMPMKNAVFIADHVSQEFSKLYECEIGDIAYIDHNDHIYTYKCYRKEYGTNETSYIADKNGYDITNDNVYVMYTCTDNSYNILLTFWEPVA